VEQAFYEGRSGEGRRCRKWTSPRKRCDSPRDTTCCCSVSGLVQKTGIDLNETHKQGPPRAGSVPDR
jgi:hypothetical protein